MYYRIDQCGSWKLNASQMESPGSYVDAMYADSTGSMSDPDFEARRTHDSGKSG